MGMVKMWKTCVLEMMQQHSERSSAIFNTGSPFMRSIELEKLIEKSIIWQIMFRFLFFRATVNESHSLLERTSLQLVLPVPVLLFIFRVPLPLVFFHNFFFFFILASSHSQFEVHKHWFAQHFHADHWHPPKKVIQAMRGVFISIPRLSQ